MRILALDLGKSKTVACDFEAETAEHDFESVPTRPEALHDLILSRSPDRVVIEICSAAGWIHDLIKAMDVDLQVANPNEEGWRWRNTKRKTDRLDALKLAKFSAVNQLPTVYMPSAKVRQWRALIHYRERVVGRRTQIKNHIRALVDRQGLILPHGRSCWTRASVALLQSWSEPLEETDADSLWRGELYLELEALRVVQDMIRCVEARLQEFARADKRVERLQSIPGVGPRLAEAVVAVLDDPGRFKRGKHLASYVGLVPWQHQSGGRNRLGQISGRGHRLLRKLLIEVSWLGLQHNAWMREVYERTLRETKTRKKTAIVAVARRLLIRCWAMLRDETVWQHHALKAA